MSDHARFGWILLALGLLIAGVGLVWILAPSIPWLAPCAIASVLAQTTLTVALPITPS